MRTTIALLLLLAAAPSACTTQMEAQDAAVADDAMPPAKDGADADGGASLSCTEISQRVQQIIAEHVSCADDKECTIVTTACGLPGDCDTDGIYANLQWRTAEMDQLLSEWQRLPCGPKACICPRGPVRVPACNRGVCGPKITGTQALGAACTADADCLTGQCLTEAEDKRFTGGYCTLKGCDRLGTPCPTGSACQPIGPNSRICLQECDAMRTCRAGYGCCGPGPRLAGWCSPKDSPVCMLR